MEGKDLRRITDRMGAFKDLLDFLPYLPRTPESRELFTSLAHQLQVPLQELDRAVKSRQAARTTEEPDLGPQVTLDLDDHIRGLILLSTAGHWRRVQALPAAWWENLTGAPLLQALLDVEGDPTQLPEGATAALRRLEAKASSTDEAGRDAEVLIARLEGSYIDRELQANSRLLQDPRTLVDGPLTTRVMARQNDLITRQKELSKRRRGPR